MSGTTVSSYQAGPITLSASGSLTVTSTGTIGAGSSFFAVYVPSGIAATVSNAGSIDSTLAGGAGIDLLGGGAIANNTGGVISGDTGIKSAGGNLTVTNNGYIRGVQTGIVGGSGTLIVYNDSGTISGATGVSLTNGAVNNYATIDATNTGVALSVKGNVSNSAYISGTDVGVLLSAAGAVYNSGKIVSSAGAAISLANGGTVSDSGLLQGAAYALKAGGPTTLIAGYGASLVGSVAVASGALELSAFSGSVATLAMNGKMTGFNTIAFDTGASWLLQGTSSELTGGQTISGFGGGDTIDLASFAATSETFQAGVLTLSNGSTTQALTLTNELGQYTNSSFGLSADGTGGTNITVHGDVVVSNSTSTGITLGGNTSMTVTSTGVLNVPTGTYSSSKGGYTGGQGINVYHAGDTILNQGSVYGYYDGILLRSNASITNAGSIGGKYGISSDYTNQTINVSNSGTISGNRYGVWFSNGYVLNTAQGNIQGSKALQSNGNATIANSGTISGQSFGVYLQTGTVINHGTIQASSGVGVALVGGGASLETSGLISGTTAAINGRYRDTVIVDPGARFTGNVNAGRYGTLVLGAGSGTLDMGGSFTNFNNISFTSGSNWNLEGTTSELAYTAPINGITITGFTFGDTLTFTDINPSAFGYSFNGDLFTFSVPGIATQYITFASEPSSINVNNFYLNPTSAGFQISLLCFYPGTAIATPAGEVAVEALRVGDLVLTSNGPKPVRWIGESHVSTRFADPLRCLPIRITAGALGGGLPQRDLLVSPDHALFLKDVLVQAAALVGQPGRSRERNVPESFTYYHVELASHELLYAEGAPVESFVDNVDRMHFSNWDERTAPVEPIQEMPYPRVKSFRQLPSTLRALKVA